MKEKVDANSSQIPCVWMIWVHKLNFETWILTISLKLPRVWILLNISLPFFLNIVLHYWNQTGTCLNTWIKIFSLVFSFSLFVTLLTREMFQFCLLTDMPLKVSISISRMRYSTKHQLEFFFLYAISANLGTTMIARCRLCLNNIWSVNHFCTDLSQLSVLEIAQ